MNLRSSRPASQAKLDGAQTSQVVEAIRQPEISLRVRDQSWRDGSDGATSALLQVP